jgi:hypothetical protein
MPAVRSMEQPKLDEQCKLWLLYFRDTVKDYRNLDLKKRYDMYSSKLYRRI